jgi:hypothetical protein
LRTNSGQGPLAVVVAVAVEEAVVAVAVAALGAVAANRH